MKLYIDGKRRRLRRFPDDGATHTVQATFGHRRFFGRGKPWTISLVERMRRHRG